MKPLVPLLIALALPWSAAHADSAEASHRPTRMQMCQHELRNVPADQRHSQARICLQRRAKAEITIERDCKRQSQTVKGESHKQTAQLRRAHMRNCMDNGLSRPYAELPGGGTPRRTVAAPRKPAPAQVVPAANTPSVQPAAGEANAH